MKHLVSIVLFIFFLPFFGCGEESESEKNLCEEIVCQNWQNCDSDSGNCVLKEGFCEENLNCGDSQNCNLTTHQCEAVLCKNGETKCTGSYLSTCSANKWSNYNCESEDLICILDEEGVANCKEGEVITPICRVIEIDLHVNSSFKVDAINYTATANNDRCDFVFAKSGSGPMIALCDGISARDNGNGQTFVGLIEAPNLEHTIDSPPNYVIGDSWKTGGTSTTGFIMSKNIYTLKRENNSYAKIEVISAIAGKIKIKLFSDPNFGNNLNCLDE